VITLVSGTVSAAARSLGHTISFCITGLLMLVVGVMLYNAAATGLRSYLPRRLARWGPFAVFCLAVPLIMADLVRHMLQDSGVWPECGNNPYYSRVNTTDPFPDACYWSSAQYRCTVQCCVPVWHEGDAAAGERAFQWSPPTPDFFGGTNVTDGAPQFATLRGDGTLYYPPGFDKAQLPYRVFEAPLVLFADNTRNPLTQPRARPGECEHGVNAATGYCYLRADEAEECSCSSCQPYENMLHLSPIGWLFTFFFTYAGFALLAVAVLWNANVVSKLKHVRKRWNELRAQM
jgi:hypothetical protein